MRDIAIDLKHRPGELARIASLLSQQQVTLRAGAAVAIGTRMHARFVPSDIDAARRALDAANMPFVERDVVPVLLERRAGELAMLSARLADGGVAVHALYLMSTPGDLLELAIVTDNAEKAARVLDRSVFAR